MKAQTHFFFYFCFICLYLFISAPWNSLNNGFHTLAKENMSTQPSEALLNAVTRWWNRRHRKHPYRKKKHIKWRPRGQKVGDKICAPRGSIFSKFFWRNSIASRPEPGVEVNASEGGKCRKKTKLMLKISWEQRSRMVTLCKKVSISVSSGTVDSVWVLCEGTWSSSQ